jgi:hypothetical protein
MTQRPSGVPKSSMPMQVAVDSPTTCLSPQQRFPSIERLEHPIPTRLDFLTVQKGVFLSQEPTTIYQIKSIFITKQQTKTNLLSTDGPTRQNASGAWGFYE